MLQPYAWALSQATQSPTEAAQNVRNVAPRRPRKDTCCQSDTRRPRPPVQPHLGTVCRKLGTSLPPGHPQVATHANTDLGPQTGFCGQICNMACD